MTNLEKTHEIMCGGNLQFSVEVDALGMQHVDLSLAQFDEDAAYDVSLPHHRAVLEAIHSNDKSSWQYAVWAYTALPTIADQVFSLLQSGWSSGEEVCHDLLQAQLSDNRTHNDDNNIATNARLAWPNYLQHAIQLVTGHPSEPITNCHQLNVYCWSNDTVTPELMNLVKLTRSLCAHTCGCNSLLRGKWITSVVDSPVMCPAVCLDHHYDPLDKHERWNTPCSDVTRDDTQRWSAALSYLTEMPKSLEAFKQIGCKHAI